MKHWAAQPKSLHQTKNAVSFLCDAIRQYMVGQRFRIQAAVTQQHSPLRSHVPRCQARFLGESRFVTELSHGIEQPLWFQNHKICNRPSNIVKNHPLRGPEGSGSRAATRGSMIKNSERSEGSIAHDCWMIVTRSGRSSTSDEGIVGRWPEKYALLLPVCCS